MRNKIISLLLFGLSICLQSCGNSAERVKMAPACDDERSISMVRQITERYVLDIRGPDGLDGITLELNNINTDKLDPATGANRCSAELVFTGPRGANKLAITYTTELIPGKDDQFFVTVDGL